MNTCLEKSSHPDGKDAAQRVKFRAWSVVVMLAVTFLVYAKTLAHGFVFDDHVLIEANGAVHSWRFLPVYFSTHIWAFGNKPHALLNAYRPLLLVWLRLNDALFGARQWGWHLSLVLLHVAVTYLVYRFALALVEDDWTALAAGLIFGLDPVHLETVAQPSWADQPLSTLFILAAILAWWRGRAPGAKPAWIAASMAFSAAALLSKESALMLPMIVAAGAWIYSEPVVERSTGGERARRAAIEAAPFVAVALAYLPLRIWALKGFSHVATPVALPTVFLTIPSILVFYLRLLIWPVGLACYYDTPYVSSATLGNYVAPGMLLLAVVSGLVVWWWKVRERSAGEARAMALAALWMFLFIVPVLNFRLLVEGEIAHDRYLYLSSVGFAILGAMGLRQASRYLPKFFHRPAWGLAVVALLSSILGILTVEQSRYWRDDRTLYTRAHEIAPHNALAAASLAIVLAREGKESEAMGLYREALGNHPSSWIANVNLAYQLYVRGDYAEATRHFQLACIIDPTDAQQFLYLGMSLLRIGHPAEAEKAVRTALALSPDGENYHLGMGMVMRQEGKLAEARREIGQELTLFPQNGQAQAVLKELNRQMQGAAPESP